MRYPRTTDRRLPRQRPDFGPDFGAGFVSGFGVATLPAPRARKALAGTCDDAESISPEGTVIHIPGLGRVDWTDAMIDAHAQLVGRTHRPDRRRLTVQWHGIVPVVQRQLSCCVSCAQDWPCPELRWAQDWLMTSRRLIWL